MSLAGRMGNFKQTFPSCFIIYFVSFFFFFFSYFLEHTAPWAGDCSTAGDATLRRPLWRHTTSDLLIFSPSVNEKAPYKILKIILTHKVIFGRLDPDLLPFCRRNCGAWFQNLRVTIWATKIGNHGGCAVACQQEEEKLHWIASTSGICARLGSRVSWWDLRESELIPWLPPENWNSRQTSILPYVQNWIKIQIWQGEVCRRGTLLWHLSILATYDWTAQ